MPESFGSRLKNAWNAFMNRDPPLWNEYGGGYSYRPDKLKYSYGNDKTIISAICNKIALDCASVDIMHVQLDENNRYLSEMPSGLNRCLTLSANKDQTSRAFRLDLYSSLFDEGCICIVPVDTTVNPNNTESFDILTMRVGKITKWYPDYVRVKVYNDKLGLFQETTLEKSVVCIIENPLYSIMNEPNSVVQRLKRKLSLLDIADEQTTSGRLDMIIQLPYVIKTEARRKEAEKRREEIENQLTNSRYGIAYADGTERIIQLNRPVENNLMTQIEYLTNQVYTQLGMTPEIMNGTADDKTMQAYYSRIIEPIVSTVVDEMRRKWISKTARTQRKSIVFFRDPFKLVPTTAIADMADKLTRNEIMSSNEIRQIVGLKPVSDPKADELRNKNLNAGDGQEFPSVSTNSEDEEPKSLSK